jgi:hypothetical protein
MEMWCECGGIWMGNVGVMAAREWGRLCNGGGEGDVTWTRGMMRHFAVLRVSTCLLTLCSTVCDSRLIERSYHGWSFYQLLFEVSNMCYHMDMLL